MGWPGPHFWFCKRISPNLIVLDRWESAAGTNLFITLPALPQRGAYLATRGIRPSTPTAGRLKLTGSGKWGFPFSEPVGFTLNGPAGIGNLCRINSTGHSTYVLDSMCELQDFTK